MLFRNKIYIKKHCKHSNNPPLLMNNVLTKEKITLGKMLYFEPRLSKSALISCNWCHNVALGGTDFQPTGTGHAWQHGTRNDPTTFNAVYNFAQFWDGRAKDLAEQAKGPIANPIEMGNTHEIAISNLKTMPAYVEAFKKAFPEDKDPVSIDNVAKAIEAFEATLITPDSKFDKYLKGDTNALSNIELAGLKSFLDNGCNSCHSGVILGGSSFDKFGVIEMPADEIINNDLGRYNVTKREGDRYVFKVPMLRNIELTAPYFHSGKVWKLSDAVKVMAKAQVGVDLTDADASNIVAFLRTLTGVQPEIVYPILPAPTDNTIKPVL